MKTITHLNLRPPMRTFHGQTRPGYHPSGLVLNIEVCPGQFVRLWGSDSNNQAGEARPFDRTFRVGDHAKYDSYNLVYDGPVVSIGAKSIGIDAKSTGYGTRRLSLHEFGYKNHDYNRAKVAAHNAAEMMCI